MHTAASGDAMMSILSAAHPSLAAVDIAFLRQHGLRCLSACERAQSVQGFLVFGLQPRDHDLVPSLYRFSLTELIHGYDLHHIAHGVLGMCQTMSRDTRTQLQVVSAS